MPDSAYHAITVCLLVACCLALALAIGSLIFMIVRWRGPQRRGHVIRLIVSLAALPLIAGVFIGVAWLESKAAIAKVRADQLRQTSVLDVGDRAPDFTLTDADGAKFTMAGARGKVVLINFFATWCGPCLLELPHLERIWAEHRNDEQFQLVVIGREESMEAVREFRSKHGFTFPIVPDPKRSIYSLFAKRIIPRTIVVSPAGAIVYSTMGFDEQELEELKSVLATQLAAAK